MHDQSNRPLAGPNATDRAERARLPELLSAERLSSYEAAVGGGIDHAIDLYEWNLRAAGAVMVTTGMVEVVVRNSLDLALTSWAAAARHRGRDWLDVAPVDHEGRADITRARERATRRGRDPEVHGKVIAELSFGFWRFLVASRYLTTLWIPALHNAFPHGDSDNRTRRIEVERLMRDLTTVRNRAAHLGPIYRRDLLRDLSAALRLTGGVDPAAATWVRAMSDLPALAAVRPRLIEPSSSARPDRTR
ncbi:MAG: hypothetical protein ACRCXL_12850 [Dermatophilaceae bacterium]